MKTLNDLADFIDRIAKGMNNRVIKAQEKTAQQILNDVVSLAPYGKTGKYQESITAETFQKDDGTIVSYIGSDLIVGPTKWGSIDGSKNNPAGSVYNLGYLLEHGTFEHAIPNAFNKGFYWGYIDEKGTFHKGTLDSNWHPGGISQPHYSIALEMNKKRFKDNIKLAWRNK